ncbi:MAG TPA: cation diffusion facilitator family transporter [Tenuifilaceae bacterium]|jgi:cobalt-zinc-cadmium efflux system protein|nr:cation diffusion facilitator family transporter [Bacteroidales bacterium]MDI9515419.1 cation diffusion facilitator family transporter [Bacteroidota bacterium]NLH57634.1 cation transporter [Rikenellaceae bacterium]OQC63078.1 MAG: Cadmium, cobalt and zinc/H(+)-K(+) antiporter [Bacteroidetes bacterium ADurb.Bin008]HNV82365.1 cation diffusion facilitator family transporter [Tenuifilaceae bacterium]
MTHIHAHNHSDSNPIKHGKAFAIGIGLNIAFVVVELFYGVIANSSALIADAGHNASDVLGLGFAWAAAWMATLKPKGKYTYGLRKTTILVSMLNALLLFGAVAIIAWDAIGKFTNPQPVGGKQVMIVAGIGIAINTFTALLFFKGQKKDLNIRGAFLHMVADAAVSLGVVIAGLLISITGKVWIDPVTSLLIVVVIMLGTWHLFVDSVNLALDAVPEHIDIERVREFLLAQEGVEGIHDLHIWAISTTQVSLTVHLVMPEGANNVFIQKLQKELDHKFGINHTTFQVETKKIDPDCNAKN